MLVNKSAGRPFRDVRTAPCHAGWDCVATQSGGFSSPFPVEDKGNTATVGVDVDLSCHEVREVSLVSGRGVRRGCFCTYLVKKA